jgi:hydroxymethylbilane synthase
MPPASDFLRLGTRASPLARLQTQQAIDALSATGVAGQEVLITTQGDRDRTSPLTAIGGQGIFVHELEAALLDGRIDVAVHSAKDVPRTDVRDVLVSRDGQTLADLPPNAILGCSSRRRIAQMRTLRDDLDIRDIRGNVDTRLAKLASGDYDAIVLAAAGLARLGRLDVVSEYLSIERVLPPPGQGAIALQARSADDATIAALQPLNSHHTEITVRAERGVLTALGAGCTLPVGALARLNAGSLTLIARVSDARGERNMTLQLHGDAAEPDFLGQQVGEEWLRGGAADLLAETVS